MSLPSSTVRRSLRLLPRAAATPQRSPVDPQTTRRELMLRSSEFAALAAIFHFSGNKPGYLGVQKSPQSLALCPATNNCVSTSEEMSDANHYAPPWPECVQTHKVSCGSIHHIGTRLRWRKL